MFKFNIQHFATDGEEVEKDDLPSENEENENDSGEEKPSDNHTRVSAEETEKELLKSLGFESKDDLTAALKERQEFVDAQKTEQEKQAEELQKANDKSMSLEKENQDLTAKLSALQEGVHPDYVDEVVTLAKAKGNEDIGKAIGEVLEKFPTFKGDKEDSGEKGMNIFAKGEHQSKNKSGSIVDQFKAAWNK